MPVAQGVQIDTRRAIIVGLVGIASAIGVLLLMLWMADTNDAIDVRLGDSDFRGIDASNLSAEIADNGPAAFPDLVGRNRPIWVVHEGTDPATGWSSFFARVPGKSTDCLVQWDTHRHVFVDSCDASTTFPPDGDGLERLVWQVLDGELRISINVPGDGS